MPGFEMSGRRRVGQAAALLATLALIPLSGCGGDDGEDEETTAGEPATSLAVPEAEETIQKAQARIVEAVESGDCDLINELNPVSREALDTEARCEALQTRLSGLKPVAAAEYRGGGVIDFREGDRWRTAVLVLDEDGLYHLAYVDTAVTQPNAEAVPPRQFDQSADDAVEALAEDDCKAFIAVANRRYGIAAAKRPESAVCPKVEKSPVGTIAEANPDAELERLGGNANYAFFGISSQGVHYTIVMARQSDVDVPNGTPPLPEDAAEYGYVDAFRTNISKSKQDETQGEGEE